MIVGPVGHVQYDSEVLGRLRFDRRGLKVSVMDVLVLGLITRILKGVVAIILESSEGYRIGPGRLCWKEI